MGENNLSVFREFHVHHSTPDGILVQLPDGAGFGRVTKETLGNDVLADALYSSFAKRSVVPLIATRHRDRQGYRLMTVNLGEAWNELVAYPTPIRYLLGRLVRKHLLVGLGTTTSAHVVRSTAKGIIFKIHQNTMGLAVLEQLPRLSHQTEEHLLENIEVRLLNFDATANIMNVTANQEVVERTPLDTEMAAMALRTLRHGQRVRAKVLLSSTDDQCAVVEVTTSTAHGTHSVLGYYLYDWPQNGGARTDNENSASLSERQPAVGSSHVLTVELVGETQALRDAVPFVILSSREFPAVLAARRTVDWRYGDGLVGHLPWRHSVLNMGNGGHGCCLASCTHGAKAGATDSDDDEDNNDDADTAKRVKKRKLEEAVDEFERGMGEHAPGTPEDFQRLLLASPNSSYLWTQYMAFHVKLQQLEESRRIAEKALNTISLREDGERLNVWVAYMNLENLYGTVESLNAIFKRALPSQSDPFLLYERLADIFESSRKPQQLLSLCRSMTSKWRQNPRAWERLGQVLVDQNKRDQLKRMLKDMGECLKKDQSAMIIVRLAVREFKQGSVENGRALMEGILAKLPKKSDIWLTYIDQEVGLVARHASQGSLGHVRHVFDRAAALNFTAKVTQLLFTKYMNFEKSYGTAKEVDKVKQMARSYVEAKVQAVTQPSSVSPA